MRLICGMKLLNSVPVCSKMNYMSCKANSNHTKTNRGIAQSGRAPSVREGGRRFESLPPRPILPFDIRWNEPLGLPDAPYMHRYMFNFLLFSIRVHIWHRSDDKRYMHNHAFDFITIVLKGGYTDVQEGKREELSAGSIRFRKANHLHFVGWPKDPTVTLLFCGPKKQNWGFKVNGRIMRPLRYFSRYGHPSADEE